MPTTPSTQAFLEALGYGATNYGGSGRHLATPTTTIYHVTSLDDAVSNPAVGTFRYGVETLAGPRTIVFDVGGVINVQNQKPIIATADYLTIAGQTAPGRGIELRGPMELQNSHTILRGLTIRPSDLSFTKTVISCVLDHEANNKRITAASGAPFNSSFVGRIVCDLVDVADPAVSNNGGNGGVCQVSTVDPSGTFLQLPASVGAGVVLKTGTFNLTFITYTGVKPQSHRPLTLNGATNVMIDHCTMGWGIDSMGEYLNGTENVTVMRSLFHEGLANSFHPEGEHSKGWVLHNTALGKFSLYRNALFHVGNRAPRAVSPADHQLVENVIYNFRDEGAGRFNGSCDVVRNHIIGGPDTAGRWGQTGGAPCFFLDNLTDERTSLDQDETEIFFSYNPAHLSSTPVTTDFVTDFRGKLASTYDVYDYVRSYAGAHPMNWDTHERRLWTEAASKSGAVIDSQADVGGYVDSDYPTIVDPYEEPANPHTVDRTGYTRLETDLEKKMRVRGGHVVRPKSNS